MKTYLHVTRVSIFLLLTVSIVCVQGGFGQAFEHKFVPADNTFPDRFGAALDLYEDTAIVGAPGDEVDGVASGSAYILRWEGGAWAEQQKLVPADVSSVFTFGSAVAIHGDIAMVRANTVPLFTGPSVYVVYVFQWDGEGWKEIQQIEPDSSLSTFKRATFGAHLDIEGDWAFITANEDDDGEENGAVFVYNWTGASWAQTQSIAPENVTGQYGFGYDVVIDNGMLLVGNPTESSVEPNRGVVYEYALIEGLWGPVGMLAPGDASTNLLFGSRLTLNGDVALVQSLGDVRNGVLSGSVYVFRKEGEQWREEQKLLDPFGRAFDNFGNALAVYEDYAVVGIPGKDQFSDDDGSAFVYRWDGSSWVQAHRLTLNESLDRTGAVMGVAVAMNDRHVLVGAREDEGEKGSIYTYRINNLPPDAERTPPSIPDHTLLASAVTKIDVFGSDIALSGDHVLISDASRGSTGNVYAFVKEDDVWREVQELTVLGDDAFSAPFSSISVSGDIALLGAKFDSEIDFGVGAAYAYRWDGSNWVQEQKLLPEPDSENTNFGETVSVYGNEAVVGGNDRIMVFHHDGTAWEKIQEFGPDGLLDPSATLREVIVYEDILLAGFSGFSSRGEVQVFVRDGVGWRPERKLEPFDLEGVTRYGSSMSFDGETLAVGALHPEGGAVFLFKYESGQWSPEDLVLPTDVDENFLTNLGFGSFEYFGEVVSIRGDNMMLGLPRDTEYGYRSGSMYLMERTEMGWVVAARYVSPNPTAFARFGSAVALGEDIVFVGSGGANTDKGDESGIVYAWDLEESTSTRLAEKHISGKGVVLQQNFPNPFHAETVIPFEIQQRQHLSIQVYDLLGRRVETIFEGNVGEGAHQVVYRPANLAAGVYHLRLTGKGIEQTRPLVVSKF